MPLDDAISDAIAAAIQELRDSLRSTGKVTAIVGAKVQVTVQGGSVKLPKYTSYTPTIGDVVLIDTSQPGAWVVTGKPG